MSAARESRLRAHRRFSEPRPRVEERLSAHRMRPGARPLRIPIPMLLHALSLALACAPQKGGAPAATSATSQPTEWSAVPQEPASHVPACPV